VVKAPPVLQGTAGGGSPTCGGWNKGEWHSLHTLTQRPGRAGSPTAAQASIATARPVTVYQGLARLCTPGASGQAPRSRWVGPGGLGCAAGGGRDHEREAGPGGAGPAGTPQGF